MIKQHIPNCIIFWIINNLFNYIFRITAIGHLFAFFYTLFKVTFCPSLPCFYSIQYHKFFERNHMPFKVRYSL